MSWHSSRRTGRSPLPELCSGEPNGSGKTIESKSVRRVRKNIPNWRITLKSNRLFASTVSAVLAVGTIVGVAASANGQKAARAPAGGKQWLAAMDTDHDGTVSKEEFNAYMDAQFAKAAKPVRTLPQH